MCCSKLLSWIRALLHVAAGQRFLLHSLLVHKAAAAAAVQAELEVV